MILETIQWLLEKRNEVPETKIRNRWDRERYARPGKARVRLRVVSGTF